MLRIPGEGDVSVSLITTMRQIAFSEDDAQDPRGEKRSRATRTQKDKEAEIPDCEASAGKWRSSRKKGKRVLPSWAMWIITIAAIIGVVFFLYKEKGGREFWGNKTSKVTIAPSPRMPDDEDFEEPVELQKIMQRSHTEFLALAKPMAETFLAATSINQILPLVRDGEKMKAKIYDYYPNGKIKATPLYKFNASKQVSYKGSSAAVTVLTTDLEIRQLAFVDGKDGLRIDWESWVGWSQIPWDKLIESKRIQPTLIRTNLRTVDYYNFGFADDSKWRAYQLSSPDGAHTLYGYVERGSLLDERLRPSEKSVAVAVTLTIRFPDVPETNNQVVIHDLISDGWLLPETTE